MVSKMINKPRDFPAVEELLQSAELADAIAALPRPVAARIVKDVVARKKEKLAATSKPQSVKSLIASIKQELRSAAMASIGRVINATGVLVHTNLGRAPLSPALFDEIKQSITGYCNVEFNVENGKRGNRGEACEEQLALLSGAESGTVVNNCAAALFVILNSLANRKKVIISRGELVQIGGGFRIPDILKRSGGILSEVGTTNITTLDDYANAIDAKTGLILKVHQSNFVQAGFTEGVSLKELVALGKEHGIPVVNDLGSGVFVNTKEQFGYAEPTVQESVATGAALTCFSGDKLLGGVQSGLIVGQSVFVTKIKKNPIFRTVRVDKIVFSILEKLLAIYLNGTSAKDIKLWQLLSSTPVELRERAKHIISELGNPSGVSAEATRAYVGGGALPEKAIDSVGIIFSPEHNARHLMKAFRAQQPPVIGRIENDRLILDVKAVDENDLSHLVAAIRQVLEGLR